jgi:succinoglycan biosynthesis transport protein ExoP
MNASQINWDSGNDHSHSNAIVILHRLMRGKYLLTLVFALVFGITGGAIGYLSQSPQYRSTGVIRIQPSLPKVLYESEQSTAPKMFSSFVSSQAQLISNGRVIQNAIDKDDWNAVKSLVDLSASDVQRRLVVKPDRRAQEIIKVSFSDENPVVSATIVSTVMDSYLEVYGSEGSINDPEIVRALESRKSDLLNERKNIDNKIASKAEDYRTENLAPLIQNNLFTLRQLQGARTLLIDQKDLYEQFRNSDAVEEMGELTLERASAMDPMIADMLSRRVELVNARQEMMDSEGLREEHRDVRRLTAMVDSLSVRIGSRLEELQSGDTSSPLVDDDGNSIPSEDILDYKIGRLNDQIKAAEDNSEELYSASVELDALREDRIGVQISIAEVNQRLDQIQTEAQVQDMKEISGKISIEYSPSPGNVPTSDPRIKMAGMGFVGLGSLPVMAILGIGFFSHRVQYSDDDILGGAEAGIIGMLPDLGESLADKELAAASAFAVHQIRSQLQIKNTLGETQVYGVTSPAPQDGKTSLIIAMGLSFAESGDRTILVDLDFIGRGLSVHFGHTNAPSLAESLNSNEELDSLVCETDFDGLSILPAGFGDDERVSKLSPKSVGALIEYLRDRYDTVLIDSGPILGSVEAAFVAPQSDGVIVVVGRGQYKPLVKKAIDQIKAVDGNIVATIFNRASIQELRQSSSSMSVHFSRQISRQQDAITNRPNMRIGPVAGALFNAKADHVEAPEPKRMKS